MRAEIIRVGGRIIKKVEASSSLFYWIGEYLTDYRAWLMGVEIRSPETKLSYLDGKIIFEQVFIPEGLYQNVPDLIAKIRNLNFSFYGLDSNPENFLGEKEPFLVDFFPLLIKKRDVLEEQFDYSYLQSSQRYFTLENILTFYSVRLFKTDVKKALTALSCSRDVMLERYSDILPREKVRLLEALRLAANGTSADFSSFLKFYGQTKKVVSIAGSDNDELRMRINELQD